MSALHEFDLIFFGATGDLAQRKLLPALYYAFRDNGQPAGWRILGLARRAEAEVVKVWNNLIDPTITNQSNIGGHPLALG